MGLHISSIQVLFGTPVFGRFMDLGLELERLNRILMTNFQNQ